MVGDAKPTVVGMISKGGKVKEGLDIVSSLISKSLKPEVTFCREGTVSIHSVSLLLSLAKPGASRGHGTGLRPWLFGETHEGWVQKPLQTHSSFLAGVSLGPACITLCSSPRENNSELEWQQPVPGSRRGNFSSAVCEVLQGYDTSRS